MTASAPEGIRAELAHWSLGPIVLSRAISGRANIRRVATQADGTNMAFYLVHRGTMTMTNGVNSSNAHLGEIMIADDRHLYSIDLSDFNDCLILQVPTALLGINVPESQWHGRLLPVNDPYVVFLSHMLNGLWSQRAYFNDMDAGAGRLVADAAGMLCRRGERKQVQSPVDYVLAHLNNPELSTAYLSEALSLSPRAIQKSFLRHVGLTPTYFIMSQRLEKATELLSLNDSRTITDIAFDLGFNDPAFFARCFRRHFGVTPTQWRDRSERPLSRHRR